jgi:hypothetical protein
MAVNRRVILRIVYLLLVGIILLSFLIRCTPASDIRLEVMNAFIAMHKTGITNVDSELDKIDEQRYSTEVNLLKLEQVVSPAMEWLELQKTRAFRAGDWRVRVTPEGLAQLKNDQYIVTKVEFYISRAGSPDAYISSTLKVTDLTTSMTYNWEEVKNTLESTKSSLEQQWQEKLKHRDLSISTMNNLMENWRNWKVKRINQTAYEITGNGLGWTDKLVVGAWTYYRDKKELIPADKPSRALQKVLLTEF